MSPSPRRRLIFAFLLVYIFWGSTYLAMNIAVRGIGGEPGIPPYLMAGIRHIIAGMLLYFTVLNLVSTRPNGGHWRHAAIVGILLFLCGNGGVAFSQKYINSGLSALLVGAAPLWMVLLDWLWLKQPRPAWTVWLSLCIGFIGLVLLVDPSGITDPEHRGHLLGAGMVLLATVGWAVGSLYLRKEPIKTDLFLASGMQMIVGGSAMLLVSASAGELTEFQWREVSASSWWALLYLIVFGSLVGFVAYAYTVRHSPPAMAATYAYVNPLVAVLLGWWLANEEFSKETILGACLILVSVAIVVMQRRPRPVAAVQAEAN